MTTNQTIDGVPRADLEAALKADASRGATASELVAGWAAMERLRALLEARHPSEDELIASGLGYPFSKEEAVQLWYSGFKTEPITVLEAWDAIGHDIGCNPSKDELLDSLRNMAAICEAHGNDMPAPQPQGEPVAWMDPRSPEMHATISNEVKQHNLKFGGAPSAAVNGYSIPLYAEQPAPVAVVIPVRSPKDYAIEHAEYMAKSADDVMAKFQAYGLAIFAVDEGGDDGEGELLENIDSARGDLQESLVELRSMVYEFRKRAAESR